MSTSTVAPKSGVSTPAPPRRNATFVDSLRSEWLKLSTIRSTWITLVVALAIGVGLGTLISAVAGSHYDGHFGNGPWDPTAVSLRGIVVAQLAMAVLGVLVVTSEYSTGMIRTSLAATPRRGRFLAAKLIVYTAVALVVSEVMAFAAFLLGQMVIGSNAPHTNLAAPGVLRAVIGAGLYLAVIGLLGAAFGALLRNTAGGISSVVALIFVLPLVLQALPDSWRNPVTEFWPTQAGSQILVLQRDPHTLAAWTGFAVLIGFAAIVVAAAAWAIERRDA